MGHLSTFRAEKKPKSLPLKIENNALTLPEQFQNNFEKVQKMTFSTPKWSKMNPQNRKNEHIFDRKS